MADIAMIALLTMPLVVVSYLIAGKLMPKDDETNYMWNTYYNLLATVILFLTVMGFIGLKLLFDSFWT